MCACVCARVHTYTHRMSFVGTSIGTVHNYIHTHLWTIAVQNRHMLCIVSSVPAKSAHVLVRAFAIQGIETSFAKTSSARNFRQLFDTMLVVLGLSSALKRQKILDISSQLLSRITGALERREQPKSLILIVYTVAYRAQKKNEKEIPVYGLVACIHVRVLGRVCIQTRFSIQTRL